jgi:succinate dehydrogenase / fumarate reductase membrane anchor subunit
MTATQRWAVAASRIRGLHAGEHGLSHWVRQRVSALLMLVLLGWFVWFAGALLVATPSIGRGLQPLSGLLHSPCHALLLVLFLGLGLWHGMLGMRVIVEDYVRCPCGKAVILVGLYGITLLTGAAATLAIVTLHVASQVAFTAQPAVVPF